MFKWSYTPNEELIEAIKEGKLIEAEKLIDSISDHAINFIDDDKTALSYAAENGSEKVCELLVNKMSDHVINYNENWGIDVDLLG